MSPAAEANEPVRPTSSTATPGGGPPRRFPRSRASGSSRTAPTPRSSTSRRAASWSSARAASSPAPPSSSSSKGRSGPAQIEARVARSSVAIMHKGGGLGYHTGIAFNRPIVLPELPGEINVPDEPEPQAEDARAGPRGPVGGGRWPSRPAGRSRQPLVAHRPGEPGPAGGLVRPFLGLTLRASARYRRGLDRSALFPFIDLHRHLDGSVRLETILELGLKHGLPLPATDLDGLRPYVQVMEPQPGLAAFLERFKWMTAILVDEDACRRIAYENVEDARREGIDYLELRFSPWFMAAAARPCSGGGRRRIWPTGSPRACGISASGAAHRNPEPALRPGRGARRSCRRSWRTAIGWLPSIWPATKAAGLGALFVDHFRRARDAGPAGDRPRRRRRGPGERLAGDPRARRDANRPRDARGGGSGASRLHRRARHRHRSQPDEQRADEHRARPGQPSAPAFPRRTACSRPSTPTTP